MWNQRYPDNILLNYHHIIILSHSATQLLSVNSVTDIPEVDFPWPGWLHAAGMFWCCGFGPLRLRSPVLVIWAMAFPVKPPVIHAYGICLCAAGGSWGVTGVPEGAACEMTSLNPNMSRPQSPQKQGLSTEMCLCVCVCGSWTVCVFPHYYTKFPSAHLRGATFFEAISVHQQTSPFTSYWANIQILG